MTLRWLAPSDRTDWFWLGWIAACLLVWAVESRLEGHESAPSQDRPDWATLTECDLQALADGDAQTIQSGNGDLYRLEAADVETNTDE